MRNTIFVEVKIKSIITLFIVSFLFTGCGEEKKEPETQLEKIQKNRMDLPNLRFEYYDNISFKLSQLFEESKVTNIAYHSDADVKMIKELFIYFSVESFSAQEAKDAQFSFDNDLDLLNSVHDLYASKRIASLDQPSVSIKKFPPEEIKFPGIIQVISGSKYQNTDRHSYFFATIEIDSRYFVFQLIGKQENMTYLYDDFLEILASIKF